MSHPEVPEGERRPPDDERATFRRSDFRLMRRAARACWGVPDELKNEALFQAAKVLADPAARPALKLAASRFLVECDRADQSAMRQPPPAPAEDRPKRITIPDAPTGPGPTDTSG